MAENDNVPSEVSLLIVLLCIQIEALKEMIDSYKRREEKNIDSIQQLTKENEMIKSGI